MKLFASIFFIASLACAEQWVNLAAQSVGPRPDKVGPIFSPTDSQLVEYGYRLLRDEDRDPVEEGYVRINALYIQNVTNALCATEIGNDETIQAAWDREHAVEEFPNGAEFPFASFIDSEGKGWEKGVLPDGTEYMIQRHSSPTPSEEILQQRREEQRVWKSGLLDSYRAQRSYASTNLIDRAQALPVLTSSTTAAQQRQTINDMRKLLIDFAQAHKALIKTDLDEAKGWKNTNAPPEAE